MFNPNEWTDFFDKLKSNWNGLSIISGLVVGWCVCYYFIAMPVIDNKDFENEGMARTYDMLEFLLEDISGDKSYLVDEIESLIEDTSHVKDEYLEKQADCEEEKISKKQCYEAYWKKHEIEKMELLLTEKKSQLKQKNKRILEVGQQIISLRVDRKN